MSENNKKNKTIIDFKKEKRAYEEEQKQVQDIPQNETPNEPPNDDKLNDWFKDILKNNIFYPRTSFYIGGNLRLPSQPSLHDVSSNATQDTTS